MKKRSPVFFLMRRNLILILVVVHVRNRRGRVGLRANVVDVAAEAAVVVPDAAEAVDPGSR